MMRLRFLPRGTCLAAACAALALAVGGVPAARAQAGAFAPPAPLEWRVVFKLVNATAHAQPGELGYRRESFDALESNEQSLRLQLMGEPVFWLDYRLDYRNVKQDLGAAPPAQASGAELFRYRPWRWYFERAESGATFPQQTLQWFHEVDHALVRIAAGPVEAVIGRQPITWGAGRVWQPTDVFAAFSPLALDTEFKPGIDGVLLSAYPFDFATVQLAYIVSPRELPDAEDSLVLRWRGNVARESELTALVGNVRGEPVLGGSFETAWLEAGWRLEALFFRPGDRDGTEHFAIAGTDLQLADGTLLLAELYRHSLGAASEGEMPAVLQTLAYQEGRLQQLSRTVLALGASRDFLGLWNGSYLLFAAPLRDDAGERRISLLHQLAVTYSVSDNATAVFSLLGGSGAGGVDVGPPGPTPTFRSEFGHVPASLYVSLQFVL
jgi:hypothetical protein